MILHDDKIRFFLVHFNQIHVILNHLDHEKYDLLHFYCTLAKLVNPNKTSDSRNVYNKYFQVEISNTKMYSTHTNFDYFSVGWCECVFLQSSQMMYSIQSL